MKANIGMKIAVCVKQVPAGNVEMDFHTGLLIRGADKAITNPYDRYAVEAALLLREKTGGTVTAFSMGPPSAEKTLREALAAGADEAVLLSDPLFAGSDAYATALTLSAAIKRSAPFDVVFCGARTTDGDTAQVGPEIAALLDLPFASHVTSLLYDESAPGSLTGLGSLTAPGSLTVRHRVTEGMQTVLLPLPCVVSIDPDYCVPRLPSVRSQLLAERAQVRLLRAVDLEMDGDDCGLKGSPTQVSRLYKVSYERCGNVTRLGPAETAAKIKQLLGIDDRPDNKLDSGPDNGIDNELGNRPDNKLDNGPDRELPK